MPEESKSESGPVAAPSEEIEAEVLVYVGDENVAKYSIRQGEYIIGRDANCQIRLDVEGVSRNHARLRLVGYEITIEDLGSANGVFIEGVQIQLPSRVRPDQQVEIGSARLFVSLKAEAAHMLEAALWDPDLGLAPIRATLEGKKYRVLGSIGRGGMGVVHQARDLRIQRTVAMKVIKTSSQFSRETVLRFVDEAQLTGQLQHPNIIPVYELGLDELGEVFYTMKFVKGTTLDQVLRKLRDADSEAIEKYPLAALLTVFQKICDAVAYAHSMGVVHRDLKPDNVMIGEYGEVLVVDWGLAKKISSGMHDERLMDMKPTIPERDHRGFETLTGLIVGTPPYISPEAARGDLDQIDPRSDIYVLGAILYAILTLRPPYPGKEFGELIEQIVSGKFTHPGSYSQPVNPLRPSEPPAPGPDGENCLLAHLPNRRVPEGLSAVILKAMAPEPDDRYKTVAELQADVLAWESGFAPKAERAGIGRQIILWAGRHKGNVILFIVFFGILSAALTVFILSLKHERDRALESERNERESSERLSDALAELRGVAPLIVEEARELIARKDLQGALSHLDSAIRQVPNEAEYHNLRGNILQSLLRWDEAVDAYEEALERNPKLGSAKLNLELTRKLIGANAEDHEPTIDELRTLEAALIKQKRIAEAASLLDKAGPDKPLASKLLREALNKDPAMAPLRELMANSKLRGRFQRQTDGTYGVDLRRLPPLAYVPLLRNQVVSISSVSLDDPNFSDLSILTGMKLTALSLSGCASVTDLTPIQGMQLQTLNLGRTGVRDLSPLAGMPLVELNLEGCAGILDFSPLKQCPALQKLLLPRQARAIGFLRDMPQLKFLSYKGLTQPVKEFWAEFDTKRALARPAPPENPPGSGSPPPPVAPPR